MNSKPQPKRRRLAGLRRIARPFKPGLIRLGCTLTERLISAGRSYDILVLFGMRRSGNHLAINWILGQVPGSAVFYNNIRQTAHPFDVGMREFRLRFPNTRPKIILSYEDLKPSEIMNGPLPEFLADRAARHDAHIQSGVILRDPYNLFASRLKKWPERFATDTDIRRQQELYTDHSALALNPVPVFGEMPVVPILYNPLVSDPAYRQDLAGRLRIQDGSTGLDDVPLYGHGSSFDGYQTQGADVRAGVFDRWRSSSNDPSFRAVIDNKQITKAAQTLFDMGPPD
ncbi:hypothetical protein AAFO92_20750 [Roseovarius sp. CAU 1744]|uniref:hypothetical protein n=1 Tax=Roseovarius sp. CAU 1744 TaxID=3140368 RepID=UPI00325B5C88